MDNRALLTGIILLMVEHTEKNFRKKGFFKRLFFIIFARTLLLIIPIFSERIILFFLVDCKMQERFNNVVIQGLKQKGEKKQCKKES